MGKTILSHQHNRLYFGEMLLPEPGYVLDFAVGLTYSLDLEALLGVQMSLGMLDEIDTKHKDDPYYLLEAIRCSADKIAVFCNAESIKLPQKQRSVFALLEQSVFAVQHNKGAFHPKLWVIKYTRSDYSSTHIKKRDDSYIKVITLSRNLTFDRSLDLAVEMTGSIGESDNEKHRPLYDLLEYLMKNDATKNASLIKREKIRGLAKDVLRVDSFELKDGFDNYAFHPFGFKEYKGKAAALLVNPNNKEIFIISPFISKGTLERLTKVRGKKTLVTRRTELTNNIINLFDDVYVVKDAVMTDEVIEDEKESQSYRDIHAKLYFIDAYQAQKTLLIGSLNTTESAFFNNVEFLLELRCKPNSRMKSMLYEDLIKDENGVFERITAVDETAKVLEEGETVDFQDILAAKPSAVVIPESEGYTVQISIGLFNEPAEIAPLYAYQARPASLLPLKQGTEFTEIPLRELTEFYVLQRRGVRILVKIPTTGIPTKERDGAILKEIIGNKHDFIKYVAFMLSDEYALMASAAQQSVLINQNGTSTTARNEPLHAVYESLLKAVARRPRRLDDIEDIMMMLDKDVVPEDFWKLIASAKEAAQKGGRRE